ncbi:site-specific integrase [bacterium]|nr:site-specific integrase [bacterium]
MSLSKQAKTLTKNQVETISNYLRTKRHGLRDQTIFLLSVKSGLRATEIAGLKWSMITNSDGNISETINITDTATKGRSGRIIPLNKQVKKNLIDMLAISKQCKRFDLNSSFVISTERSKRTSAQAVVNMFQIWYRDLGMFGCSSHSGRRTFITNAARKISTVGGSLRDVQALAGHASLAVTQRYIDGDSEARRKIVDLL